MVLMRTKVGRAGFKPVDRESDSGSTPSIWRVVFFFGPGEEKRCDFVFVLNITQIERSR
jgi:L,D-peptidoglycan transpeptidase YkuD (ErfK/YbiS/YcfS/YnhG family)